MDELDGRGPPRELALLGPGRRSGHLPALRHHQTRDGELESGAQEVHQAAQVHGEVGELQLRGRAWENDEFLVGGDRGPGYKRRQRHVDPCVDLAIDEVVHVVDPHVVGGHPREQLGREGDRPVGELEAAGCGEGERYQGVPGLVDSRW